MVSSATRSRRVVAGAQIKKPIAETQRAPYLSDSIPMNGADRDGIAIVRKMMPAPQGLIHENGQRTIESNNDGCLHLFLVQGC